MWKLTCRKDTILKIPGKTKEYSVIVYLKRLSMWYPYITLWKIDKSSQSLPTCSLASSLLGPGDLSRYMCRLYIHTESVSGWLEYLFAAARRNLSDIAATGHFWRLLKVHCYLLLVGPTGQDACPWRSCGVHVWLLLGACWKQQPIYSLHQCFL